MTWFDVDGARHYLAQIGGSRLPSRKTIYRMVAQGLRASRADENLGRKRGGSRMYFCPEWIDAFLLSRGVPRSMTSEDPPSIDAGAGTASAGGA